MRTFVAGIRRLLAYRPGRLAHSTFAATAGLSLRALLQIVLFLTLTRTLGVQGYGAFVAVLAIATFFSPLIGSGAGTLLLRNTARRPNEFTRYFGRTLLLAGLTAAPLVSAALILSVLILPRNVAGLAIVAIVISELLFTPFVEIAAKAYQAFERMGRMAVLQVGLIGGRLVALGLLIMLVADVGIEYWAVAYACASALTAAFALALVSRELGWPHFALRGTYRAFREGKFFALVQATARVHAEADKAMLARLDSLSTTGLYSAAHRVIDLIMLPALALLSSAFTRLSRAGSEGVSSAARLALRLAPVPIGYALTCGLLIYFMADVVSSLLGAGFSESADVLRWFAVLPVVALLRSGTVTVAGVSGQQRLSAAAMLVGAIVNIGLNLWLIPLYSWQGAVVATYAAEVVILVLLVSLLLRVPTVSSQVSGRDREVVLRKGHP